MKTLYLLRHAKSDWSNPSLSDYDRPLNPRGRRSADAMGRYIARQGIKISKILSSSSLRTRQTVDRLLHAGDREVTTEFRDDLYLAGTTTLMDVIRDQPADADHVMLVGHNPATHALALMLTGSGAPQDMQQLERKYPTGALAELVFEEALFHHIGPAKGRLVRYIRPRSLLRLPTNQG